jgi:hypothetical protein
LASGFDLQIETGAYKSVERVVDFAGNVVGLQTEWRDYAYYKNHDPDRTFLPDGSEWVTQRPSDIMITQHAGEYLANLYVGNDDDLCGLGLPVVCFEYNFPRYLDGDVLGKVSFVDLSLGLYCGRSQKAYAGTMTDSQSANSALSGKVIDPKTSKSPELALCECGGPEIPAEEIIIFARKIVIPVWLIDFVTCTVGGRLNVSEFPPDGFDVSDLFWMYVLDDTSYRFCGSEMGMDCSAWP